MPVPGLDKISARFFRECADLICVPTSDIFNQSINQGTFPDDWKYARVTPRYKQDDRGDVNNYRPTSVIPVVVKVFERIVYEQLFAYLEEHDILGQNQSGFRANHSTVTALLEATDSWAYNIDNGKINGVIFLDLKIAFDTVDHQILLSKLNYYGIHGKSFKWFQWYLENRTQKCSGIGSLSNSCSLTCGVPQRTILDPLLFLLYINDLPNCLSNCKPRMYADDTHLTYACGQQSWECSVLSKWRPSKRFQLATSEQTHIEHDQNWIHANRVKAETEYSHSFTNN